MDGARRYVVALEQRRSRLLAPRQGGGVRLRGNVWLSRSPLHPVCRFAQDDTWVRRNVVRNLLGWEYSSVKLTDTAFCFLSHAPAPHRVILSEAAQPAKNQAHPQIIAAQSNPAPSGAPAGGISLVEKYYMKQQIISHQTNSVPRPCPPRVILSEAAQISKIKRTHQSLPHSEPRPKRGASRRDLRCSEVPPNAPPHPA